MVRAATCIGWSRKTPQPSISVADCLFRPLDTLTNFRTATASGQNAAPPVRYAIRQALDQEYQNYLIRQSAAARQGRYRAGGALSQDEGSNADTINSGPVTNEEKSRNGPAKRDFFGRIILEARPPSSEGGELRTKPTAKSDERKVWVSFHEGFSK